MASVETLIFNLIARDAQASAAFDRFRRSVDGTTGSVDKNTASLQKNTQAQKSALGGTVGLGFAFSAMVSPIAAAGSGVVAFAALAAPSVLKVQKALTGPGGLAAAWGTLDNRQKNMALGLQALGHRFTDLSSAMEPRTAQVFGTALGEVNKVLGPFSQLAQSSGKALEDFLVQFSQHSGLNQFITFMSHEAGPAIKLLGTDITNITKAVFSLLQSWGGLGLTELKAVTAVITGITGSLTWLAVHAPGLTSAGIAIGGLALALSKFGLLAGALKLTGIASIGGQMAGFAAATRGATLAEKGLLATTTVLDSINPLVWVGAAAIAVGVLVDKVVTYRGSVQDLTAELAKQDHASGLNVAGYARLAKALGGVTTNQREFFQAMDKSRAAQGGQADVTNALTAAQQKAAQIAQNLRGDFDTLGRQYGVNTDQAKTLILKSGALNDILAANGRITPEAAQKIRDWAQAENKATGQTNTLAEQVTSLTDAMNKNVTAVLTLQGDEIGWRQALQAADKQLASNSAGLHGNSANALANKQAVIAATNAAVSFADDQLKLHGNLGQASQAIESQIKWLQKHGDKSKFAREEIHALRIEEAKIKAQIGTNIVVHGSGHWDVLPSGKHIVGTPQAAGGLITGGVPGRDSVPILAMPGEVVIPAGMVARGAVDHLRGKLPGFAAGGVVGSYGDGVPGMTGWLGTENAATVKAVQQATASAIFAAIRQGPPGGGVGGGPGGPVEAVARALFPWAASQWPSFNYVEMREAGYNLNARNPSSGAFGVAQFINGPSEYFQWGGNPFTAAGQFTGMFNYIRSRYGNPVAAAQHEAAFNWYGGGLYDGLFTRPTLIGVGDRGPERVNVTPAGSGATLDDIAALLGTLIGAVDDNAQATAAGVAGAIGGTAHQAMYSAMYSAR